MLEASLISTLLGAAVAAFSVLGGVMALVSGYRAADHYLPAEDVDGLGDEINIGIALGFVYGMYPAALAMIVVAVS